MVLNRMGLDGKKLMVIVDGCLWNSEKYQHGHPIDLEGFMKSTRNFTSLKSGVFMKPIPKFTSMKSGGFMTISLLYWAYQKWLELTMLGCDFVDVILHLKKSKNVLGTLILQDFRLLVWVGVLIL